jgi:hypothetical protein
MPRATIRHGHRQAPTMFLFGQPRAQASAEGCGEFMEVFTITGGLAVGEFGDIPAGQVTVKAGRGSMLTGTRLSVTGIRQGRVRKGFQSFNLFQKYLNCPVSCLIHRKIYQLAKFMKICM